jgi:hypothetical protein
VSLTDDSTETGVLRYDGRLRIGTAELNGYSATHRPQEAAKYIVRRVRQCSPDMTDGQNAQYGRLVCAPATPSDVPYGVKTNNLFLNWDMAPLGWTHSCGSGAAIADIVSGREPQDFRLHRHKTGAPKLVSLGRRPPPDHAVCGQFGRLTLTACKPAAGTSTGSCALVLPITAPSTVRPGFDQRAAVIARAIQQWSYTMPSQPRCRTCSNASTAGCKVARRVQRVFSPGRCAKGVLQRVRD